jgi:8-oxo-dGTP pyrophosphatase MutT (NUDIX family)
MPATEGRYVSGPDPKDLAGLFPDLFREVVWAFGNGPTRAQFVYSKMVPPESLISNVNVVARSDGRFVVARLANGRYEMPGGTLERGEHYLDAARRELVEEVGAKLRGHRMFGHWQCQSTAARPYRPHLPHPEYYRVVLLGEVELVGDPTNPADGEQVEAVEVLTAVEAADRFTAIGRRDLADLYRLVVAAAG